MQFLGSEHNIYLFLSYATLVSSAHDSDCICCYSAVQWGPGLAMAVWLQQTQAVGPSLAPQMGSGSAALPTTSLGCDYMLALGASREIVFSANFQAGEKNERERKCYTPRARVRGGRGVCILYVNDCQVWDYSV